MSKLPLINIFEEELQLANVTDIEAWLADEENLKKIDRVVERKKELRN
ncbi:MAG: hypothetical protein ABIG32_02030 [Candidatus Uhrbacteria bacterium]|nr:hypothetical protein [Patescibacteria group bacterium]MBU1906621.1 hypothetical protein [Patescibacteria group bacterium]